MTPKRFGIFVALNVAISLVVTLVVLYIWQNGQAPAAPGPSSPGGTTVPGATASGAVTPGVAGTPVPTPGKAPVAYTVQSGDTLSTIADQFDVSLEDLMAANGLTDPNTLSVGQQLIIPIGGLPTPTPTPTVVAVPPTPIATTTVAAGGPALLKISQVESPGVLSAEGIVIVNDGTSVVRLEGWTLTDQKGNAYTFPLFQLFPGGAVTVHTAAGENGASDLYWGRTEPVWTSGSTATLRDAGGAAQVSFAVP